VPDTPAGHTVSAAAIEYQGSGGFSNADLTASQVWNEQALRNVTHVVGGNDGTDTESELDVQMLSQAADGATLWFWNSERWLYALAVELLAAPRIPQVVSMSWGWAEDRQCDVAECGANLTSPQYVTRVNFEYLKLALRGVTVVAASGDAGAPGRTNEGCDPARPVNPVFPGGSPYVLSVGATVLRASNATLNFTTPLCRQYGCPTGSDEMALSFETVGWTGGGGFDLYSPTTPWWQAAAVAGYLASGTSLPPFHRQGRAYPDVSAVGHRCPTVQDGQVGGVDGTSCSAPVVAGLMAWLNSRRDTPLGFVNPLLYHLGATCPHCLHDVHIGHNWCTETGCCGPGFGFAAAPGYDPVTGLGTLNVSAIAAAML
jgi:tripeptidyl-peptidase-1